MVVVLLKLFLAPLLVVASTLAGRRWGDGVTGILVALPIVAGPILLISYEMHGAVFAAAAATSSLLGLVSLAVFAVVFARLGRRCRWAATTAGAWAAVLLADAAGSVLPVAVPVALAVTVVATAVAIALMPAAAPPATGRELAPWPLRWDLASRAAATAALVLAITSASGALGPRWTGLLAPFPTALTVVAVFTHAQRGPAATTRTLHGALRGLFGFAVFCAVVALLVLPLGAAAFLVGVAGAVVVQLLVLRVPDPAALRRRIGRAARG